MKKIMLFAALLTVISAASFATGGNDVKVISDSSAVFKLYYSKPLVAKVKVKIFNAEGEKVFSESIKNENGFVRPYNMSSLPAGTYKFEIDDNTEIETFEFVYAEVKTQEAAVVANIVKMDEGKFFLGVSSTNNDKVQIDIYNDSNEVVYSAEEVVANQFGQLYNLQSVKSKRFTLVVKHNGNVVKETSF